MPLPTREVKEVKPTAEQVAPANKQAHPPVKLLIHGEPGWGKTSLAAGAPGVMFITSPLEQGIKQLVAAKRVQPVPVTNVKTWSQVFSSLNALATQKPEGLQSLALDALGGFESLLAEYVTDNDFGGDFTDKFQSYGKGWEVCARRILREFLLPLQAIHDHGVNIILIAHSQPKTVQNPTGKDYDRWQIDLNKNLLAEVERWATDIGFGTFTLQVDRDGKATGTTRVLKMQNHPAYSAKSQTGFGGSIDMGTDAAAMWGKMVATYKGGQ